jgi:hypothetical protein
MIIEKYSFLSSGNPTFCQTVTGVETPCCGPITRWLFDLLVIYEMQHVELSQIVANIKRSLSFSFPSNA